MRRTELSAPEKENTLSALMRAACADLGNPAVLIDTSYNLLASTENTVRDDPPWNELMTLGHFSHEMVDFFFRENFVRAFAENPVVAPMVSGVLPYDRVAGKIFDENGIQLGCIVVVACYRPFEVGEWARLEAVCERFSESLRRHPGLLTEQVFGGGPLGALIAENTEDAGHTGETAGAAGGPPFWPDRDPDSLRDIYEGLKPHLFLLIVDISRYDPTLSHLAYFRDLFARLQDACKCDIYLNHIVILTGTDRPLFSVRRDLPALGAFFERYGIYAGVSGGFQNLLEARDRYRQALAALNHGMVQSGNGHVFCYDDFRIDHFLDVCKDAIDAGSLIHPLVPLLRDYDAEHGTRFFETLRCHMFSGLDAEQAALLAGTDLDTLRGRLQALEELFEVDWRSGHTLFSLTLSYKILESA
ncbi:MAG: hypothetical protein LBK75_02625 [Oscillospiraceae bacterium]|jgi:hypothetical protein|nr:hypothetical protein [Oscillospiraceae bacterium]